MSDRQITDAEKKEYWGWVEKSLTTFSEYTEVEAKAAVDDLRQRLEAPDVYSDLIFHEEAYNYAEEIARQAGKPWECEDYRRDYVEGILEFA